jgi:outer membrane protein assembly factor BamB
MARARQLQWSSNGKYIIPAVVLGLAWLGWYLARVDSVSASDPGTDWPMWGGRPDRNMVSNMKGLPVTWDVGKKVNVKWVAALGSQAYGNPVVADGKVFVGTNNEGLRDPKQPGDRGVLMAFRESDGQFLWQSTHEKLAAGRVNDWPYQGVCSSPLVEGKKLYYVSNRCELLCVDTEGFRDGENNGPYKEEKLTGQSMSTFFGSLT